MSPSWSSAQGGPFNAGRWMMRLLLVVPCVVPAGCWGSGKRVVHGTVTVGGQRPDAGEIRFIPIEGTPGGTNAAVIVDGAYRIEARRGVPVGKYRVEVAAKRKTGRKVEKDNGFETAMVEETVPIGPPEYVGEKSPLIREITADSDGRIDIEIPAR
jgi:hypothetical protein